MSNHQNYSTKNLFVASFLMASGEVQFNGLQRLDPKTKLFLFSPTEKAEELEAIYFSGGSVSSKLLFAEYNNLKDLLFQRETNGEKNEYYNK